MFRPTDRRRRPAARRGVILVVVLALLTIFAVVGIAFVYYSDGEMVAARYHRESENRNVAGRPALPPFDTHAEDALNEIIFGVKLDDVTPDLDYQVSKTLRGHAILSTMYGARGGASSAPYNGAGIIHEDLRTSIPGVGLTDRARIVNHTAINLGGKHYIVDPDISGTPREVAARTPIQLTDPEITGKDKNGNTVPITRFHVAKNAPYTYPDLNNFYLASVSPATGQVLVPSYYRNWAFNTNNVYDPNGDKSYPTRLAGWNPDTSASNKVPGSPQNTDWVTAEGRAKILRPRPIDQLTSAELLAATGKAWPPTEADYSAPGFNATALYNKIDEKIRSGEIIGYPRPNADGSTTGDVFSYIGGVGTQRNDTILIDFGAAEFEWPPNSGKRIKPLAAVLVTDTDGLLNLNAHGNNRNTGGTHGSYQGFGPHEVNLEAAAKDKTEASTIVASRYGSYTLPGSRAGSKKLSFDPSDRRVGLYGQVNWDATGTLPKGTQAVTLPGFAAGANPFAVVPTYATGFFDDNKDKTRADNHPALFNPSDWAAFLEGRSLNPLPDDRPGQPFGYTYSHADTRRLHQGYARELDLYQQSTFHKLAGAPSGTLVGSFAAGPTYRQDPAHTRRGLFTTLSAGHDVPGTMPQGSEDKAFILTEPNPYPTQITPQPTSRVHASNLKLTAATAAGTFLGPVNLNRPLADYRGTAGSKNLDTELSSSNIANANQAWADRHNLARDVFIRLVVSTGAINTASVSIDTTGNLKLPQPSNSAEYNGLRYLAQLAANVADYVDGDDVSTMFVWNSVDTSSSPNGLLVRVSDTSVVSTAETAMADPTKVGERVVFGVEVPRLVINEVYSEVVNDPSGKVKGKGGGTDEDGLARFWVELMNPASPVSPAAAKDGVLGTGKVVLKDTVTTTVKPYKLVIARGRRGTTKAADDIRYNPANVAGNLPTGYAADIDYDFRDAGAGGVPNTELEPNNGLYDPDGEPTRGVVVAGPKATGASPADEFDPKQLASMPTWTKRMIETTTPAPKKGVSDVLEYRLTNPEVSGLKLTDKASEFRRHVVLLRRLVNPYLAEDAETNPYVTVDVMDWLPANDGVFTGNAGGSGGGVTMGDRAALGRVQPYAGHAYPDDPETAALLRFSFPTSGSLHQQPTTTGVNEPRHTFGRHNGKGTSAPTATTFTPATVPPAVAAPASLSDTVMAPYDWLVHLDRPLVNQLDLLHLQAGKPHEVTYYFLQPPATTNEDVRKQVGLAPWFGISDSATAPQVAGHPFALQGRSAIDTTAAARSNSGLFRGLEFLRAKPWTYGVASGGRVHGRLNLNTIQDLRVWNALSDPQAANGFSQTNSDKLWTNYFTSVVTGGTPGRGVRTFTSVNKKDALNQDWTVPSPGETIDDLDPKDTDHANKLLTVDRPFKPFGTADAGVLMTSLVSPNGSGLQDTILRADADPKLTPKTGRPLLWPATATHPYLEAELARKVFNNTTTMSNVFTVHVTIVYHEVRLDAAGAPTGETVPVENDDDATTAPVNKTRHFLGRESFRDVPGDMRQQYLVVVDRSQSLVQPPYPSATQDLAPTPFHVSLAADLTTSSTKLTLVNGEVDGTTPRVIVQADGQPVTINDGTKLRIGTGPDADWVKVIGVDAKTGEISFEHPTDNKKAALERYHPAGEVVTNAAFGRPVKPANFTPISTPDTFRRNGYPLLIPYAGRVR